MQILVLFFLFGVSAAAAPGSPVSSTSILAPGSTPAKTIFSLSMFVLAVTAIIFFVVAALPVYSVVKFRARGSDAGHERPRCTAVRKSSWLGP